MEDEFLKLVGEHLVKQIQKEIMTPRARFTKAGAPKRPPTYNMNATGRLYKSVQYIIRDGEIDILMNDYGVNYVFGEGSKPSYPPSSKKAIESLEEWIKAKGIQPRSKNGRFMTRKSMAFAIGKNLNKVGYKGVPLLTDDFQEDTRRFVNNLLEDPKYQEIVFDDIFDRINLFGEETYNLALF